MADVLGLKRLYEAAKRDRNEERFFTDFRLGLEAGEIGNCDYGIKGLFEQFVEDGRYFLSDWESNRENRVSFVEAGANASAFLNITGQLMVNMVMQRLNDPTFISSQLVTTRPTRLRHGEKVIGLGEIGNEAEGIGEAKPYPYVTFGEDWIQTPETIKRGMICALTREMIVDDLTGQLEENAARIGYWIGYNREIRTLQTALGITTSYSRKNNSNIATYGDDSGTHDWDNLAASNALVDWTDIENAELLFDGMTDPNTGEPVMVVPNTIVVPTALKHTARRIVSATEIEHVDNQANAVTIRTRSASPIANYTVVSNNLVKTVTSSDSTWFLGDFRRAFRYMEVSPPQVVRAPSNSHDEFVRDVVSQWKVSEWGVPAVFEPRYVVKSTA